MAVVRSTVIRPLIFSIEKLTQREQMYYCPVPTPLDVLLAKEAEQEQATTDSGAAQVEKEAA